MCWLKRGNMAEPIFKFLTLFLTRKSCKFKRSRKLLKLSNKKLYSRRRCPNGRLLFNNKNKSAQTATCRASAQMDSDPNNPF